MKNNQNVQILTEGAMMVALAVVLSVVSDLIGLKMPQSGSVSLSTLPIVIFALRRGSLSGALVGLSYGIINLLIDGFYHWGSIFFDYVIPFTLVGFLSGLFSKKAQEGLIWYTILAALVSGLARYLCHSFSGVIFFSDYVPEGMTAFYYSFIVYNAPYMLINTALNLVILLLVQKRLITINSRVV
jgi:thiamine transporter